MYNNLLCGSREEVLQRQSPLPGHVLERPHRLEALDGRLGIVQRVITTQLLSEPILHSRQLQHRTNRPSSDHTGSFSGRTKHHAGGPKHAVKPVRERGRLGQRHGDQVALGINSSLLHGHHDLLGRRTAHTDGSILVSDNHDGPETQLLSSLDDLGHSADLNDPVLKAVVLSPIIAPCRHDRRRASRDRSGHLGRRIGENAGARDGTDARAHASRRLGRSHTGDARRPRRDRRLHCVSLYGK
mmetsp:Transcript_7627/g.20807  ORF Transcript_7627/g.20807 Transcript_7627/m.20807 type:complete len:242 (+) Transcript_7627:79-804(+)